MAFKFKIRKPKTDINLPSIPVLQGDAEDEALTGMVQGMQASAPEERMARALDKLGITYQFRYTVGAPRGLPGWKELDFLIQNSGLLYAYEVDTAFTHREKSVADVLHDSIILNDSGIATIGELYPHVFHVDGELDLADQKSADKYVKKQFGVPTPTYGALPSFEQATQTQAVPQTQVTNHKTGAEKKIAEKKRKQLEEKKKLNEIRAILNNSKNKKPPSNKR